ncbi:MAG TPA: hypothetical protein VF276_09985, partial [Chloroflexia bacterium]
MSRAVSWAWAAACLLAAGLVLAACGNSNALLSGVSANPATVRPTGLHPTEPIQLTYTLGRAATVTLHIQGGPDNAGLVLRPAEQLAAG